MPFLYVYDASDFIGGLPDEVGAAAAGSPNFRLRLAPNATPRRIEVADNDAISGEIDATQSLASAATINGTNYAAGMTINTAYDLINTGNGHEVTTFHLGGDGYQQGPVAGLVSTVRRLIGCDQVLVAACKLTTLPGVAIAMDICAVHYLHLVLDAHEVVWSEGLQTESFYCAPMAPGALSPDGRAKIAALFPHLGTEQTVPHPARHIASGSQRPCVDCAPFQTFQAALGGSCRRAVTWRA